MDNQERAAFEREWAALSEEVLSGRADGRTGGRADGRAQHPHATLSVIEAEHDTRLARMRARMRARVAQQSATRPWRSPTSEQGIESEQEEGIESEQGIEQEEGGPRCPSCGARLEPRGRPRRRRVRTSGGQEVALDREYGVCAQCGQGLFPPG